MAVFLTGATGYIGSYVAARLLAATAEPLNVLVRAADHRQALERLWQAWQLHFDDFSRFRELVEGRVTVFTGDLTAERFGLDAAAYERLCATTDSVIHCAASLNRRSEKSCLNVNLRGTLEVIELARAADRRGGLRRFSHVSTVAVAGHRAHETVHEDTAIDWERSDYDPYARTKKFSELMVRRLLPPDTVVIFRPSVVLGDSQRPETTQFDMVRAFAFLAALPVLPLAPQDRIDIVPVDYVADAIVHIHNLSRPRHAIYHLSAGERSERYRDITDTLTRCGLARAPLYVPALGRPFAGTVGWLANHGPRRLARAAALLKVFWPYLVWDTVFDNSRVVAELGRTPAPFTSYCARLLDYSRRHRFQYPYRGWPIEAQVTAP